MYYTLNIVHLKSIIQNYLYCYHNVTSYRVRVNLQLYSQKILIFVISRDYDSNIEKLRHFHEIIYNKFWMYFSDYNFYPELSFMEYDMLPENKQLKKFRKMKLEKLM